MKLRRVGVIAAVLVATVGLGAAQGGAHDTGARTIQARGIESVQINVRIQSTFRMVPGVTNIKSGAMLTFKDVDGTPEPHTLTIADAADLPQTIEDVENCSPAGQGEPGAPPPPPNICNDTFQAAVQADPRIGEGTFPGPGESEFLNLGGGGAGLDARLDTMLIGDASSLTVPVTAAPGTTLHFLCAIHPWMQGTINVG
jgi:hypothetical protein